MQERPEQYQVRAKDLAEDSIEKCWIPLWSKVPKVELTEDEAKDFLMIGFLKESDCEDFMKNESRKENTSCAFINKAMLQRFDINLDYKTQLWLSSIMKSPGQMVMIFAYMKWRMHDLGVNSLDFTQFSRSVFPFGFPSDEDMQWLWTCQKLRVEDDEDYRSGKLGNMLDHSLAYKSFL